MLNVSTHISVQVIIIIVNKKFLQIKKRNIGIV